MAAAGDELLGLHKELDLADAAAAELYVVPLDRDLAMAAIGVDLPLHAVDVGDRGKVEILAPDEGRQVAQKFLAGGDVAGAGARLDHSGALPITPDALVVVERRRGRDRDLSRAGIRPQPQIGAEDVAVGRAFLQEFHQAACEPHIERRGLGAGHERWRVSVVEHDEVDIAGIVELAGAHLAHRQHDVAASDLRLRRLRRTKLCRPRSLIKKMPRCRADRGIGQCGERGGDPRHRPDATDVSQSDQERRLRPHAAKELHHMTFVERRGDRRHCIGEDCVETNVGIGFKQREEPRRIRAHKVPQIGRAVGQAEHECAHLRMFGEQPPQDGGFTVDLGEPIVETALRFFGRGKLWRCDNTLRQREPACLACRRWDCGHPTCFRAVPGNPHPLPYDLFIAGQRPQV